MNELLDQMITINKVVAFIVPIVMIGSSKFLMVFLLTACEMRKKNHKHKL